MARSLRPLPRSIQQFVPTEDMIAKPIPVGGLSGMDVQSPLITMSPDYLRLVRNLVIREGVYETRHGTDKIGLAAASDLLYACDVKLVTGEKYLVRFLSSGVEIYSEPDGAWQAVPGSFAGDATQPFAITGWNDRVVFSGGVGKCYELTFGLAPAVAELVDSPEGVIHLATFNGRIVASLKTNVVQWTIKFDHTDWSGLGSGFEDLRSAAGGVSDRQTAVIPITAELAYCVRTESVWAISNTGDPDVPFAFTRVYSMVGSRTPMTVVSIKLGCVFAGLRGQVWVVTPSGIEDIAAKVSGIFNTTTNLQDLMSGAYEVKYDEYRIIIPSTNTTTGMVMRYSFMNKAWTQDTYPFPIRSIATTVVARALTIDELVGPTDDLTGSMDDLGVIDERVGFLYAMRNGRFVVSDAPAKDNDALRDISYAGTRVASGFRLESGDVRATYLGKTQEIIEYVVWYESAGVASTTLYQSQDGGVTWTQVSAPSLVSTLGRPRPLSISNFSERAYQQLAYECAATPIVKIIRIEAILREGARIVDTF